MTFKNQNDYSCTVFLGSRKVNFMKYVGNCYTYASYLDSKNIKWSVMNVYNRRTGEFITRFYYGSYIEPKPK